MSRAYSSFGLVAVLAVLVLAGCTHGDGGDDAARAARTSVRKAVRAVLPGLVDDLGLDRPTGRGEFLDCQVGARYVANLAIEGFAVDGQDAEKQTKAVLAAMTEAGLEASLNDVGGVTGTGDGVTVVVDAPTKLRGGKGLRYVEVRTECGSYADQEGSADDYDQIVGE